MGDKITVRKRTVANNEALQTQNIRIPDCNEEIDCNSARQTQPSDCKQKAELRPFYNDRTFFSNHNLTESKMPLTLGKWWSLDEEPRDCEYSGTREVSW